MAPEILFGIELENKLLAMTFNHFGKTDKKRKRLRHGKKYLDTSCWKQKSIFFKLEYQKHILFRHNLDVMHIEKNVCDSTVGTILTIPGKKRK